ncbi:MAG: hypothetical protein MJ187_01100 [Alphaproteobacteria bacterium]|nr:hypothetical protein [Alphaproteobacteria bacterium]
MKKVIISFLVKAILPIITISIAIWYVYTSIGGGAITYSSMDRFLNAVGANGNIANTNGCFLCEILEKTFGILGDATEKFWSTIVNALWVLMAIGFGIYLFIYSGQYILDAAKTTTKLDTNEKKIDFSKWFETIRKLLIRILIVGALIGVLGVGGNTILRAVSYVLITPVLYIGSVLSMMATGAIEGASCYALTNAANDVMGPVFQSFMCVIGNLNSVMLAGVAGGFSLMNYAWMGMGGGIFTWMAGLTLVIMFIIIGFDLFFQILTIIFKLIFIIIFLPFLLAAAAWDKTWSVASGAINGAINMIVTSALSIISITLKTIITYATITVAADAYFPAPMDGYTAIFPPTFGQNIQNPDNQTLSVVNVFKTCEEKASVSGVLDKDKFITCFTAQRAMVERKYPHAFDFMSDGWEFIMIMILIFFLYYYVISPKIDDVLVKPASDNFDFGGALKTLGKNTYNQAQKYITAFAKNRGWINS